MCWDIGMKHIRPYLFLFMCLILFYFAYLALRDTSNKHNLRIFMIFCASIITINIMAISNKLKTGIPIYGNVKVVDTPPNENM